MAKPTITMAQYNHARNNDQGWCTNCNDFTRDCTESDADGYDCEVCGKATVIGVDNALVAEVFDIGDDE